MSSYSDSRSRSSAGSVRSSFARSVSPSGRFYAGGGGGSATTSSSFSSFFRSASPTRVNLVGTGGSAASRAASVRFSLDHRSTSPGRSLSFAPASSHVVKRPVQTGAGSARRTCMCSPTNHPGSFRCSLHKNQTGTVPYSPNRLNARRSAMTNSLVRIGTVEGDLVKRALAALIRPSSHQQRRRSAFQPQRSRLSAMTKADDL
ncbi:uncharacterized protein M6B38_228860 [Iris pallida]|uniref:Serine-rich protein-like protein n=1 Tax=Iris pallida TaxID=29817 RepID=A0AAX6DTF0_IRIPA|nr:uncharacterized protein M6B38_228860 [Iris pallida]